MSSPKSGPKTPGPRSSPRRTAQEALNRAAKAAQRPRMEAPPQPNAKRISADAKELAAAIARGIADGQLDILAADALQTLLAATCRLYAARHESGENLLPVPRNSLSATEVMVTASGLLRAADLAAFELGMWQGWTGR
jgi:hypothetical protein